MQNTRRFHRVLYAYYVYYMYVVALWWRVKDTAVATIERNGSRVHAINQMENYNIRTVDSPQCNIIYHYRAVRYTGMEMSTPSVGLRSPVVSITFSGPHKNRINILLFFIRTLPDPPSRGCAVDPYMLCTNNQTLQKA